MHTTCSHSFPKKREREGGQACFETYVRKTEAALATALVTQGFEP